jgi:TonB family protein
MLPFALVLSGAIHAAVIGISHDVVPKLTADPSLVYTTQLDAVLIDIAQDKGETPLPSQAAAESIASAGEQNPQDDLEQELEKLEQLSASLEQQLKEAQTERRAEAIRYEAHIDALLEQNTLTQQDSQRLSTELAEQKSAVAALRTTVQQLSQDLDLEKNVSRQLQASQLKHQSDLIDLQTEKELVTSQNQQLTDRLTQTQSSYEDSVVQLHETASRLAETRSENQELVQALASSEKTTLDLQDELAQVINEATLERQTMAQGQKAVEEHLEAISIELDTERASNERLQAQTERLDQTLAALRIDQQKNEAAHKETNARLADAQSALRSTEEKHEVLQGELSIEREAMEERLQAVSIELKTERASNKQLRAETNRLDQMLTALQIDQQNNEAAHKETNARLADAQSALRSTEKENDALRRELSHVRKNAADLKEQFEQAEASKASLDTGNALSDLRPVPTAGNPKPVYPRMAIRRGIEGEVRLSVSVTALGKVSRISINKPSGSAMLDQAAIDSVRKWQFTPAIRDGVPTAMVVDIPIQFRLIDSRG